MRLPYVQSEPGVQAISLFVLDGLANVLDLIFHIWMGRILIPSEFAILQTLNSVVLVYVTASGVFQPVVGRFIAEGHGKGQTSSAAGIFQSFLRAALWLGLVLGVLVLFFANAIAHWLNLPAWTIQVSAALIFLSSLRPVAVGMLQGSENFVGIGLTRLALSLGRVVLVLVAGSGFSLAGAVVALPFGWLVSVLCAFLLIGRGVWQNTGSVHPGILPEGWRLSFYALLAYLAYMSLTSLDLVWVNQNLSGELAGAYASLVLMRRIVALLPAVAVTVMFPRVVKILARGNSPARLLAQTGLVIFIAGGALSFLYFVFGETLVYLVFGNEYQAAIPLLGWMSIAMMGISLSSIWLNYYLAEKPRSFVILLAIAVVLEWTFLNLLPPSLQSAVLAFGITGWSLSIAGLFLYLVKTRTSVHHAHA